MAPLELPCSNKFQEMLTSRQIALFCRFFFMQSDFTNFLSFLRILEYCDFSQHYVMVETWISFFEVLSISAYNTRIIFQNIINKKISVFLKFDILWFCTVFTIHEKKYPRLNSKIVEHANKSIYYLALVQIY